MDVRKNGFAGFVQIAVTMFFLLNAIGALSQSTISSCDKIAATGEALSDSLRKIPQDYGAQRQLLHDRDANTIIEGLGICRVAAFRKHDLLRIERYADVTEGLLAAEYDTTHELVEELKRQCAGGRP